MLERLFPHVRGELLHDDADLVAVDKPAGVSTASGEPGDAIARVRALLAERASRPEKDVYLASHVPLERDASGVAVFVRRREANAAIARAMERGELVASYVAAVDASRARGKLDVRARRGSRALVAFRARPGRAKEALAKLGVAIAGDPEGGPPAHRVMLHLEELALPDPHGRRVSIRAPLPSELEAWVQGDLDRMPGDLATARARIVAAAARRYALARDPSTTAFRLVHDAGDAMSGVAIDLYDDWAVLHVVSDEAMKLRDVVADALAELGAKGVYWKLHPKEARTMIDPRREEIAPARPVRGAPAPDPLVVLEGGDRFVTRLGDGLSTGIFLDQRDNRALVKRLAKDRSVLNLFAYACAFTVSAASGGAARTVSVDVSKSVLAWGEENLRENGLHDPARHRFVAEDAQAFLGRAKARGDRFDVIVLDPPSFASTKSATWVAEDDYASIASACLAILAPGGRLLACTNHRRIREARLRKDVAEAARRVGRELAAVKPLSPPVDFPRPPGGEPHLKTVLAVVR